MTFAEITAAVLADSFESAKLASAKTWVNARYGWIWDSEEWMFKQSSEAVTVTAGSQAVSAIAGTYSAVTGLSRADGTPLKPIDEYRDFAARYIGTGNAAQGIPEAFCVVGASVFVGPTSSETSTAYLLVGELALTLLVADGDIPAIPAQYHLALVHGAKAEGYKLSNVERAQSLDADFQEALVPMRRSYLRAMRGTATQAPAYRPGG